MKVLTYLLICLGGMVFLDGLWNFFALLGTAGRVGSDYFYWELLIGLILFIFGIFLRKKFAVKTSIGYYILGIFAGLILWQIVQVIYYASFYRPY